VETRDDTPFVATASEKKIAVINLVGVLGGGGALYLIARAKGMGSSFFILWALLAAWLLGDWLVWRARGVREIRIDSKGFEVVRGLRRTVVRHDAGEITDLALHTRMRRKSLQIMMGGKVTHIPGIITLYLDPNKIWITSDAFEDSEFDEVVRRLQLLHGRLLSAR